MSNATTNQNDFIGIMGDMMESILNVLNLLPWYTYFLLTIIFIISKIIFGKPVKSSQQNSIVNKNIKNSSISNNISSSAPQKSGLGVFFDILSIVSIIMTIVLGWKPFLTLFGFGD